MKVDFGKADIDPYLWLQEAIERKLEQVVLQRAIAWGTIPEGTPRLWNCEFAVDRYEGTGDILVTYWTQTGNRVNDRKQHLQRFTVAEALRRCMEGE